MNRAAALLLVCLLPAACSPSGGSRPAADPATQAACRVQADRIYDTQHRADIFAPSAGVNAPLSNSYGPGSDGRQLGEIFARDNMIQDCVRRNGSVDAAPAPAPAPAR